MPQRVTMQLRIPDELGQATDLAAELEAMIKTIGGAAAEERLRTGSSILGRGAVLRQAWHEAPTTFEPRRVMSPRVAAINRWARVEALVRNKAFVRPYAHARSLDPPEPWRASADDQFYFVARDHSGTAPRPNLVDLLR